VISRTSTVNVAVAAAQACIRGHHDPLARVRHFSTVVVPVERLEFCDEFIESLRSTVKLGRA
jgi:hypothetical protein